MVTGDNIGQTVRYRDPKTQGEKIGTLAALEKRKKKFIAVIQTPVVGQRKKRLLAEDVEIYEEKK
jgi:hypothetical protein